MTRRHTTIPVLLLAAALLGPAALGAQDLPPWLRDRGPGIRTSLLGTYVEAREFLVYPFFEYYADADLEYKPSDFGFSDGNDYRGRYEASEGILFLGYGISDRVAVEFEAAVIDARLDRSPQDTSGMPAMYSESGLGDVEAQVRWRALLEDAHRPEIFTFFEVVAPLQRDRNLIGTQDWEFKLGGGLTRGLSWGTVTFRAGLEYVAGGQLDAGEYAVEYLRRLSPAWRIAAAIEGSQLDEVSAIGEVQWHFARRSYLKVSSAFGITQNATDWAPEIGVVLSF